MRTTTRGAPQSDTEAALPLACPLTGMPRVPRPLVAPRSTQVKRLRGQEARSASLGG
jgi:hypothetical protein